MTAPRSEVTEVQMISLDKIRLSPLNVRQEVDVGSLACSIVRTGQIEPLRLRPVEGGYEIRTGMRRFLALKQAGATYANAIVVEGTDEEVINEQWDENEERESYTDYERALKLRQMLDRFGLNQTELAERVGKDKSWVSRHLAILKLEGVLPMGNLSELNERQARAILDAPEEDWPALVQYVELYLEERGKIPPASTLEDYATQLEQAREIEASRRRFLYEIEEDAAVLPYKADAESPETEAEYAEAMKAYIEEHDLAWVFGTEANGVNYLTKIGMITDEELHFCLAHETRPLNIQRLNEESYRRDLRPSVEPPLSPAEDPEVTINRNVGEPIEDLQAMLMEEHGLTEEEADAALQAYRETFPDIWSVCYPEKAEEPEEPMTAEEYVADVLMHNPEVSHEELARVTAERFDIPEAHVRDGGRKPRDLYGARTLCPLCGRQNAEKNRLLLVLEEYQTTQPGITLVNWLREVLA